MQFPVSNPLVALYMNDYVAEVYVARFMWLNKREKNLPGLT